MSAVRPRPIVASPERVCAVIGKARVRIAEARETRRREADQRDANDLLRDATARNRLKSGLLAHLLQSATGHHVCASAQREGHRAL